METWKLLKNFIKNGRGGGKIELKIIIFLSHSQTKTQMILSFIVEIKEGHDTILIINMLVRKGNRK